MNKKIFLYIKHLVTNRHVSCDLNDGIASYFIEDDDVCAFFLSEYSHMENDIIFCRYSIQINNETVADMIVPGNKYVDNKTVNDVKKLFELCSQKVIYQEILAQKNYFLKTMKDTHLKN